MRRTIAILALLVGCGDDGRTAVDLGTDGGFRDDGGPSGDAGDVDAGGADGGGLDGGTAPDACVAQSEATLCGSAGAECGALTVTDRCGDERSLDCGGCATAEACGTVSANRCANEHWVLQPIDDGGEWVDMAIDAADGLHVAYRKANELHYATLVDGSWQTERIDDGFLSGDVAIAIDGAGVVHVAATAGSTTPSRAIDLWTRDGSSWVSTFISGSSIRSLDLAFDGETAHLCGYHPPSSGFGGFLTHFVEGSAGFDSATIDGSVGSSESREGDYCSIAVGSTGRHVAYDGGQFGNLKYAVDTGSGWAVEVVDSSDSDYVGDYTALALDGAGQPVIAYRFGQIGPSSIRIARVDGSGWATTFLADTGTIATHTALALSSDDRAHVTQFDSTAPGVIRYHRENAVGGSSGFFDVAEVGTGTDAHHDVVLDSSDAPHVVFHDPSAGQLVYAIRR